MDQTHDKLLTVAEKCAEACERCAAACLAEEELQKLAGCIRLDLDCAALCRVVTAFAARGSAYTVSLAAVLADICKACGAECAKHEMDHCRACASACRSCEAACLEVRPA